MVRACVRVCVSSSASLFVAMALDLFVSSSLRLFVALSLSECRSVWTGGGFSYSLSILISFTLSPFLC